MFSTIYEQVCPNRTLVTSAFPSQMKKEAEHKNHDNGREDDKQDGQKNENHDHLERDQHRNAGDEKNYQPRSLTA